MNKKLRLAVGATLAAATIALTGCTAASTASHGISVAADNFEVMRRIVFYNSITDTYMFTIEGRCSLEVTEGQLDVICKIDDSGDDEIDVVRHSLGISDNVTWFMEQIEVGTVSEFHHRIIFRPETLIPGIEVETSEDDN